MNINMNVYPNVMNVNYNQPHPPASHHQHPHQQYASVNPFTNNNNNPSNFATQHYNPHAMQNVTLETTVPSFTNKVSKKMSVNEPAKSWVD